MKEIELPPNALSIMESTRAIGYSLETAIADVMDNSITANAKNIILRYSPENNYVYILDDGHGMMASEINIAMQYGGKDPLSEREKEDLGRFGLGLKTASLSQCRCLTVLSKRSETEPEGRQWDLDYIAQTDKWSLKILDRDEMESLPGWDVFSAQKSGTLVVWENLDRLMQGSESKDVMTLKMNAVEGHLSLVFHKFLAGKNGVHKLNIIMNGRELTPADPFLTSNRHTQIIPTEKVPRTKISISPYILPVQTYRRKEDIKLLGITEDMMANQGFYIYRNHRLIIWGKWFRKGVKIPDNQLIRVAVEVPSLYDHSWILDVKKSRVNPPEIIIRALRQRVENLCIKASNTHKYRAKKQMDKTIEHIWIREELRDGGIIYRVNPEYPLIKLMLEQNNMTPGRLLKVFDLLGRLLPVHQMRIDMDSTNVKTDHDNNKKELAAHKEEMRKTLQEVLKVIPAGNRMAMLQDLSKTEPFNQYMDVIQEMEGTL